jgi:uncharacterized membrane protein YphA (DoxX/SURF4 family)
MGGYFLMSAYHHLFQSKALASYATSKNVHSARLMVILSGLLILFGGYSVLAGVRVTAGVASLVLFLIPVTFTMHNFWRLEGEARQSEKIQFMKNIALLGAVLMLLAIPTPWPLALGAY